MVWENDAKLPRNDVYKLSHTLEAMQIYFMRATNYSLALLAVCFLDISRSSDEGCVSTEMIIYITLYKVLLTRKPDCSV